MAKAPSRRAKNGRIRRQPIRDSSRTSRHQALNCTQQLYLKTVHHRIGHMIISSKKIIVSFGLINLICRLLPHTPQEHLWRAQLRLLVVLRHLVGVLHVCFRVDSRNDWRNLCVVCNRRFVNAPSQHEGWAMYLINMFLLWIWARHYWRMNGRHRY